jgi:hypothetical protein
MAAYSIYRHKTNFQSLVPKDQTSDFLTSYPLFGFILGVLLSNFIFLLWPEDGDRSSFWNVVVIVAWDDGYKSPEEGVL